VEVAARAASSARSRPAASSGRRVEAGMTRGTGLACCEGARRAMASEQSSNSVHTTQRETDTFACIDRHQAFALAAVWCDPRADVRGPGRATHRIFSCPPPALFASTS
jgi:hypothetical protein